MKTYGGVVWRVEYSAGSEVSHFQHEGVDVDEYVGRGDVSVDHVGAVYVLQGNIWVMNTSGNV